MWQMTESADFFEAKHLRLLSGYRLEDGTPDNCVEVAIEVAACLSMEGKDPQILYLTGAEDGTGNFKPLIPVAYEGRIVWGGHTICELDGDVYDPILEAPEPIESYPLKAFGASILVRKSLFGVATLYTAE